jgi:membrane-bound metal-dependent hydrolase YbcI (DUF457 family)
MDPISHGLLGRTLGLAGRHDPPPRGVVAALVLGSLAPDVDALLVSRGWDVYLRAHEAGTHTLAASPILALAVAAVVKPGARGTSFSRLWRAAWLGVAVGHLGFDLVSGSDMRIFEPFSSVRLGPHWLTMADWPAVAILFAGTLALAVRRRVQWSARAVALATLAALVALLGVKLVSERAATTIVSRTFARDAASTYVSHAEAVNGSIASWRFYQRAGSDVRAWRVDAWTGQADLEFSRRSADDDAGAIASRSAPIVRTLLDLAAVPFVRVEQDDRGRVVWWSDLRYCDADECGLSFGVRLGAEGRPGTQVVRVGPYEQDRGPVPPGH